MSCPPLTIRLDDKIQSHGEDGVQRLYFREFVTQNACIMDPCRQYQKQISEATLGVKRWHALTEFRIVLTTGQYTTAKEIRRMAKNYSDKMSGVVQRGASLDDLLQGNGSGRRKSLRRNSTRSSRGSMDRLSDRSSTDSLPGPDKHVSPSDSPQHPALETLASHGDLPDQPSPSDGGGRRQQRASRHSMIDDPLRRRRGSQSGKLDGVDELEVLNDLSVPLGMSVKPEPQAKSLPGSAGQAARVGIIDQKVSLSFVESVTSTSHILYLACPFVVRPGISCCETSGSRAHHSGWRDRPQSSSEVLRWEHPRNWQLKQIRQSTIYLRLGATG